MGSQVLPERWSRGCGNGNIGLSGGVNEYSNGVLMANWVEDKSKQAQGLGSTILSHSARPGPLISTTHLLHNPMGKTGVDLAEASQRHDQAPEGHTPDLLMRHGPFDQPPVQCMATTYQLTHGRADGTDRKPQAYVWHGRKQVDYYVPTSTQGSMTLTTKKMAEWGGQHEGHDPYATTQRAALDPAAMAVAEHPARTQSTLRVTADSGEINLPGTRPKGPNAAECDKTYNKIGLRTNYRN